MSSNDPTSKYPADQVTARLIALENRTGYRMQQFNGQRKFWNPNWNKPIPPRGCEVFVGKIPRDLFEDELVPLFEKIGKVYELRLMMDFSGFNRGYAFVAYTCREHAQLAINQLDNYEIRPGMRIGVCRSVDNCRLFVGGIPKDKTQQEIRQAMCEISEDVSDVIVYPGSIPGEQNRGFAFVEYSTHRAAAMARRKLIPGRITLFGSEVVTDWAEPEVDATDKTSRIKNVYVRNLKLTTTELQVFNAFNAVRPGAIERVKKIEERDYAFVHFQRREDAMFAVQVMNGQRIDGQEVQVSLAKPPSNKHDANNSTMQAMQQRASATPSPSHLQVYDRMKSMMMSNSNPQPTTFIQPVKSMPPDYNTLTQAQAAAKLQQLRYQQPPPMSQYPAKSTPTNPPPYIYQTPEPQNASNSTVNYMAQLIMKYGLANGSTPVSTLDHIAKIDCPVFYLDEVSLIFNNGKRPEYCLLNDGNRGSTKYAFAVHFMGEMYIPTPELYFYNIPEAKNKAAKRVLEHIDSWMKKKVFDLVNDNNGYLTKQTNGFGNQPPNSNASNVSNATSAWGTVEKPSVDFDYLRSATTFKNNINIFPKSTITSDSFNVKSQNSIVTSSLGWTNGMWDQMKYSNGMEAKSTVDFSGLVNKSSYTSSLTTTTRPQISSLTQPKSAFDRVGLCSDRLSSLNFDF
ncbi:uncharacterized protein LOC100182848 [Ciona intestinalis]